MAASAGQETAILALGKLGGREMTATSDLDLIVIYDFNSEHPESDGARPLYGAQYFSRLIQRLISALTAQTNYGLLYQVDMRLRPSGRSGPLATQLDGFASYQESEAWTWEHMALTRARVVSASPQFAARVEGVIRAVLCRARDAEAVAGDVAEMRKAIATEKGDGDRWDIKYVAGGLIDIEFIAQYLQLIHAAAHARYPRYLDRARTRQGVAARLARGRGRRGAAPGGAALSRSHAGAAAVPSRAVRSKAARRRACSGCWRAPPTCPTSRRSTPSSPRPRPRCARASPASSAHRLDQITPEVANG